MNNPPPPGVDGQTDKGQMPPAGTGYNYSQPMAMNAPPPTYMQQPGAQIVAGSSTTYSISAGTPTVYTNVGTVQSGVVMQGNVAPVVLATQQLNSINSIEAGNPQAMTCPYCQKNITTGIRYVPGSNTYIWAVICCFFLGLIGLIIAFCCTQFLDVEHYCPSCQSVVRKYTR